MGSARESIPKIVMLMGGCSAERAISLSTGRECGVALRRAGYTVVDIDAGPDLVHRLRVEGDCIAFNGLHGRWGEDGCVQGILEYMKIPYTHSGVLSSALAMDKHVSKSIYGSAGLPIVESKIVSRDTIAQGLTATPPYVLKPNNEGSSIGVMIVNDESDITTEYVAALPDVMMIEEYVPGRELTTAVVGAKALSVTEIRTQNWYDYSSKYVPGGSQHIVPAEIPTEIYDACLHHALLAHEVLQCRGISRTDFRWNEGLGLDGLVLLETNTQPGMTPTSLVPEQAEYCGWDLADLCRWIVEDASCDR